MIELLFEKINKFSCRYYKTEGWYYKTEGLIIAISNKNIQGHKFFH